MEYFKIIKLEKHITEMIHDLKLRLKPELTIDEKLRQIVSKELKIPLYEINEIKVIRRSIDARKKNVFVDLVLKVASGEDCNLPMDHEQEFFPSLPSDAKVVLIIGTGPAGLFAALKCIQLGIRPILFERGRDVDSRRKDLAEISRKKRINPVSNYCYGEGGAGAYSDGKLFTRSKKRGDIRQVLRLLVQHGASENILMDAHPHIGSDRLPGVIKNIRNTIISSGGEVKFENKVEDLIIDNKRVLGVRTSDGKEYFGEAVIVATGHSSHDTIRKFFEQGIPMEAKGLAIGVRLEHPQSIIDQMQYHSPSGRGKYLPPAEYSFVTQVNGRGVYSFCMCPGGIVVPAASQEDELVVNGMSASARSGKWANSGIVVELHPGDIRGFEQYGPLEMLEVQECLEKRMFEAAGRTIVAPAQRVPDFIAGKESEMLPQVSYAPGVQRGDFNKLLPSEISDRLKKGLIEFGHRNKDFIGSNAIMIGLESRTSSPVRLIREVERLCSIGFSNLFPAGEGAGYAGGIVSAAIDGMRCAEAVKRNFENLE